MAETYQCTYTGKPCFEQRCDGCEVMEQAEAEIISAQYMEEHFDENGDPYRDFMGNPW